MSKWLALVEDGGGKPIPLPDSRTKPDKTPVVQPVGVNCRVTSGCQVEGSKNDRTALCDAGIDDIWYS